MKLLLRCSSEHSVPAAAAVAVVVDDDNDAAAAVTAADDASAGHGLRTRRFGIVDWL